MALLKRNSFACSNGNQNDYARVAQFYFKKGVTKTKWFLLKQNKSALLKQFVF